MNNKKQLRICYHVAFAYVLVTKYPSKYIKLPFGYQLLIRRGKTFEAQKVEDRIMSLDHPLRKILHLEDLKKIIGEQKEKEMNRGFKGKIENKPIFHIKSVSLFGIYHIKNPEYRLTLPK